MEVFMNGALVTLSGPAIPPEVQEFAVKKGVSPYLNAVIDLARQAFPSSALCVSLGQDAEDERHQYIALDVEVGGQSAKESIGAFATAPAPRWTREDRGHDRPPSDSGINAVSLQRRGARETIYTLTPCVQRVEHRLFVAVTCFPLQGNSAAWFLSPPSGCSTILGLWHSICIAPLTVISQLRG
jgi:hypothetical protein